MKKYAAAMCLVFLLSIPPETRGLGIDMYITGTSALKIRTDSNEKAGVAGSGKAGEKVLALAVANGWTRIETADGLEGWVSTRYLSTNPPHEAKAEPVAAEPKTLREKFQALTLENQSLKEENISLTTRLNEQIIQAGSMEDSFKTLKKDAEACRETKAALSQREQELKGKNEHIAALEKKIIDQYTAIAIKWSMVGAGILIIGYIMGSRTKKKRSSLL